MPLINGVEAERLEDELRANGVFTIGHYLYDSGTHGNTYIAKRKFIARMPTIFQSFCAHIAKSVKAEGYEAIVAPGAAGIIVGNEVSRQLALIDYHIPYIPVPKVNGVHRIGSEFKRLVIGRCVAGIEDVVNTGGTILRIGQQVIDLGGSFNRVYCLFNRSKHQGRQAEIRITSVLNFNLSKWEPDICPMCLQGIPIDAKPE